MLLVSCQPRDPLPPAITTTGLDPAVASLIETTVAEVRAAPRSGDAWGKLGSVLMHYGFIDETRSAFERAEVLSPRDPRWPHLHALAISTHDLLTATEKFRRAAEITDGPSMVEAASAGRTDPSSVAGARTDPASSPSALPLRRVDASRLRLAQTLAERGLEKEAEVEFQALLRIAPNHPAARLGLARLRHAQGMLAEATNQLAHCLRDPHTARSAHALLAVVEQALGNPAAAAAAARASATLLPADVPDVPWPDPWWSQALAYRVGRKARIQDATALIDQGQVTEAMAVLDRATREYPRDDEVWYLQGWALNQGRRPVEAERALREHLRLSSQSAKGRAQLAVALLAQRRHSEAIDVLQAALKLKPTWRELYSNLGYACVQLNRDEEAVTHFRGALALDPNYVPTYSALAELLVRRGAQSEARRLLQQALELDPTDARLQAMLQRLEARR